MRAAYFCAISAAVSACGGTPEPEIIDVTATVMDDGAVFEWEGGPMHVIEVLACDLPFCACTDNDGTLKVTGGSDISWQAFQRLVSAVDPPAIAPPVLYGDPMEELGLGVGIGPDALQSNTTYAVIPFRYSVCDLPEGDCFIDQTGCDVFHMP